ncbi:hypothetical protein EVAR_25030_1 [Eumeta japonica]|uniref:Uncharacterized protein n=1 Tax=Eumeta variegata TaxID=151549 RepID=A0A4C1V7Y2_EUMVA|nr:hypothetical protein EVAR_25030_1 [Eumeta japonica]
MRNQAVARQEDGEKIVEVAAVLMVSAAPVLDLSIRCSWKSGNRFATRKINFVNWKNRLADMTSKRVERRLSERRLTKRPLNRTVVRAVQHPLSRACLARATRAAVFAHLSRLVRLLLYSCVTSK